MSNPNAASLTEQEVERLSKYLDEVAVEKDGMSFEMLDGFLTAVLSCPQPVAQEEWLARVWSAEGDPDAMPPQDDAAAAAAMDAILRHYRHLDEVLRQGGADFNPWILEFEDEDGSVVSFGQEWALGYLRGIEFDDEAWDELISDPEWGEDFDAIDTLARGPDDEETGERLSDQKTRDDRIETMLGFALDAYDYFAEQRLKPATLRRESPKVGRNDPCPCGSGKKYKQCHGAGD